MDLPGSHPRVSLLREDGSSVGDERVVSLRSEGRGSGDPSSGPWFVTPRPRVSVPVGLGEYDVPTTP